VVDAYVRPAVLNDVDAIAEIQLDVWRVAFTHLLPTAVLQMDTEPVRAAWREALSESRPRHAVFVAQEGSSVVGFAAVAPPAPDEPNADVLSLSINPLAITSRWTRRGHGSRLLAAVADFSRTAHIDHLTTWLLAEDHAGKAFFASAGWEPDGCRRTLETGDQPLAEVRFHAGLATDS
jgi:GNAT superfamily N-acetyltransferase